MSFQTHRKGAVEVLVNRYWRLWQDTIAGGSYLRLSKKRRLASNSSTTFGGGIWLAVADVCLALALPAVADLAVKEEDDDEDEVALAGEVARVG